MQQYRPFIVRDRQGVVPDYVGVRAGTVLRRVLQFEGKLCVPGQPERLPGRNGGSYERVTIWFLDGTIKVVDMKIFEAKATPAPLNSI